MLEIKQRVRGNDRMDHIKGQMSNGNIQFQRVTRGVSVYTTFGYSKQAVYVNHFSLYYDTEGYHFSTAALCKNSQFILRLVALTSVYVNHKISTIFI